MSFIRANIQAMQGYVPGEQPQAGKFVKLNTNENPYPASQAVEKAIRRALDRGLNRYPDATGTVFRRQAAEVLEVHPDWILCGNGSDDILTIVTRALVGEGELLRLPTPSYILYKTLAAIQNADAEEISFDSNWELTADFAAASTRVKLVFLPNPNSPSGTVVSPSSIEELAGQLPCPLLIDEAYVDFADDNCIGLVQRNEKIMVSRTLSKGYGLAGLRFGYLVAQPHIISELMKVKDSYNCDALAIAGATAAIADRRWLSDTRARIMASRERLEHGMADLGFQVPPSQANFVWCTHVDRPLQPIYEELKKNRILVRYMNYVGWGEGLRISVGTDEQIDACLNVIKEIL